VNKKKYSLAAKIWHWGFVVLFIYSIAKSVENIEQLENQNFFRFEIIFATIFLLLILIRFIYMIKTQETALPNDTPKIQKFLAKTVHLGMYVSLASIAITGMIIGFFYWLGFKEGVLIDTLTAIHEFVVTLMYCLVSIHILAAIFHRLKKDGVWSAMVPFWKE